MNNHLLTPTFFDQAIEIFSFNYVAFICDKITMDDEGNQVKHFVKDTVRGSFQSGGMSKRQHVSGNTGEEPFNFYCKNIYRLKIGDYILYKKKLFRITGIPEPYDEYGVRALSGEMEDLTIPDDLNEYADYIEGVRLR